MSMSDHDHDHDEDDDGLEGEVEVNIDPREEDLDSRGIDHDDFEKALFEALDAHNEAIDASDGDLAAPLEEVILTIGGKPYRLGDLADVTVEDDLGDDEDDAIEV